MSKVIISTFGAGVTSVRTGAGTFTAPKTREVFLDSGKAISALATAITNGISMDYGKEIL